MLVRKVAAANRGRHQKHLWSATQNQTNKHSDPSVSFGGAAFTLCDVDKLFKSELSQVCALLHLSLWRGDRPICVQVVNQDANDLLCSGVYGTDR
jgi:hypothetical protein